MSLTLRLSVIIMIIIISASSLVSSAQLAAGDGGNLSAYQVLQQYGFPVGILPKGVTGYELNRDTGEFKAFLDQTCSFDLEGSYSLRYQQTIAGVVSRDMIGRLSGVSVKVLFFWLDIVQVSARGDQLEFSVGILSASFPIDNFEVCPQCGCGLVCEIGSGRVGPSVMSS